MQNDLQKRCSQAFGLGLDDFPLYSFQSHRQMLDGLRSGLERSQRLLCLTGPPGSGKSAVFSALYDSLSLGYVGLITQPGLGDVLSRLKGRLQLGTDSNEPISGRDLLAALHKAQMHNVPMIQLVDNADKLRRQDFIQLNQLFRHFGGQLILGGTPALLSLFQTDGDAADPVQPDQVLQLEPLNKTETGEYIQHRLRQVDFDPELFSADAVTAVTGYSGGLPQLINILCFMALAESCVTGEQPITADAIDDVAKQRLASGIYPFHALPPAPAPAPAPEADTVRKEDSPSPAREGQIDEAFHQPVSASKPLADDNLFDGNDAPQVQPFVSAGTAEAMTIKTATEASTPKLFARNNPGGQARVIPTLYSEKRQPSPAATVHKPRKDKRWLIAGFASMAMAGLGLALYANSDLFDGRYAQLRHVATEKLNQLVCLDSNDNVLTSTSSSTSREIDTGPPPDTGTVQETTPSPPLARPDDMAGVSEESNEPSVSPQSEAVRRTAVVTDDADISTNTATTAAAPDPEPDLSAFDHQAAVLIQPEKPADIDRPTPSPEIENHVTAQTQPDAASEQQGLQDPAVANSETNAVPPTADNPVPDTIAEDPLPVIAQPRPTEPTEQSPIARKETSETRQSSPPLTPEQQSHIASLYLKRAEYEMRNGRYKDALISIDYGLESVPYHPVLNRMRPLVLKEINDRSR